MGCKNRHYVQRSTPDAEPLVITDVRDGVGWLTLNNPGERNTLTAAMVAGIVAAMDSFEADESVGAVVVTGAGAAFCAGADLGNLQTAEPREPRQRLRGLPAHRPQPAADTRRRERRGGGRRDEPRPRLRCAHRRHARSFRHPVPADRVAPRRRAHMDAAAHRRSPGGDRRGRVRPGARRRRGGTRRARLSMCRRRRAARARPDVRARGRFGTAELAIVTKRRSTTWPTSRPQAEAVERELEPQLWSVQQPWFAERIAALKARISSKPERPSGKRPANATIGGTIRARLLPKPLPGHLGAWAMVRARGERHTTDSIPRRGLGSHTRLLRGPGSDKEVADEPASSHR